MQNWGIFKCKRCQMIFPSYQFMFSKLLKLLNRTKHFQQTTCIWNADRIILLFKSFEKGFPTMSGLNNNNKKDVCR